MNASVSMPSIDELYFLKGEVLHQYLVKFQLIPAEGTYTCPTCHSGSMLLQRTSNLVDEWHWHCPAKIAQENKMPTPCGKQYAYKAGTFFERSPFSIVKTLIVLDYWVYDMELIIMPSLLGISEKTAIDWTYFCREILYYAMLQTRQPLGGPGITVEIDDAAFPIPGDGTNRYHQGQEVEGQRVIGGYEKGTGRVFLVPVERRDTETLVPLLTKWILPGSIIISGIGDLVQEDYEHLTVNHGVTFPKRCAPVNATEWRWRAFRELFSRPGHLIKAHVPGNLARYLFYKRCQEFNLDRPVEFFRLAGHVYDPRHPREEASYPGDVEAFASLGTFVAEEQLDLFDD